MTAVRTQAGEGLDRWELLRRASGVVAAGAWGRLASSARDPRVKELDGLLQGDVVGRSDPGYSTARLLYAKTFDGVRPLAVAYCDSADDVARTLSWARKRGIRIAPRCGGHSYGGYSTTPG
jgi:FAD binding domain